MLVAKLLEMTVVTEHFMRTDKIHNKNYSQCKSFSQQPAAAESEKKSTYFAINALQNLFAGEQTSSPVMANA